MNFHEMRGRWAVSYLLLAFVLGPPLGLYLYNLGLPVFTSKDAYPILSQFGSIYEYGMSLFLFGYLDGIYLTATAVILLFVILFNSRVLRLWWVLLAVYLSTCIWYFFQIVVNNMAFMIGFAASLSALLLWILVKLVERVMAKPS